MYFIILIPINNSRPMITMDNNKLLHDILIIGFIVNSSYFIFIDNNYNSYSNYIEVYKINYIF